MEEHENLLEKIREILGGEEGSLQILEQQIDLDLQVAYHECSQKVRADMDEKQALDEARYLLEPGYSLLVKKEILARLAAINSVEGFRSIEAYLKDADEELRDWALLALNESRMHLESMILEENQVFISTGLGGKEHKLRYFVALIAKDGLELNKSQKKVISNEFDYILGQYEAEVEEISFSGRFASLLLLIPLQHSLGSVFRKAIRECNHYGDFLESDFIVTNVKQLSIPEIRDYLQKRKNISG